MEKQKIIIVTAVSGAGRSTVIKLLQDRGFFVIDNLPAAMLSDAINLIRQGKIKAIGYAFGLISLDLELINELMRFKAETSRDFDVTHIFLTASNEALISRFGATRRRHPLETETLNLVKVIEQEKQQLEPLKSFADITLDSSSYIPNELEQAIQQVLPGAVPTRTMNVMITSFGFQKGVLQPIETLFDVRFLKNPFYQAELRDKTGMEAAVSDYVFSDPQAGDFVAKTSDLLKYLLPKYYHEGKHYFRIGIGCTGGKHRSVSVANALFNELMKTPQPNIKYSVYHRDIG